MTSHSPEAGHAVDLCDRQQGLQPSTLAEQAGQAADDERVGGQQAVQEGTPGQYDGHLVGASRQPAGQCCGAFDEEERIRLPALGRPAGGATRGVTHAGRAGIDADEQRAGLAPGTTKHGAAIAGAHVHDHPLVAGDQAVELTDVEFEETATDDLTHDAGSLAPGTTDGQTPPPDPDEYPDY